MADVQQRLTVCEQRLMAAEKRITELEDAFTRAARREQDARMKSFQEMGAVLNGPKSHPGRT